MEKIALRCDLCNGSLEMQPGGQTAICEFCGTKYSIGRLREKIQEIRGTVSVEGVVKTTSADFDIQAGVLLHYRGKDTAVVVPEGVHEIGVGCFSGMQYLTSITLPEGLVRIAFHAFFGCSGLTKITIPKSLKEIDGGAFQDCTGLKGVYISDLSSWCGILFKEDTSNPLKYSKRLYLNDQLITDLTIPNAVKAIGQYSFANCTSLNSLTIPASVSSIGRGAFCGCSWIKTITFPDTFPKIEQNAFCGCSRLQTVEPASVFYQKYSSRKECREYWNSLASVLFSFETDSPSPWLTRIRMHYGKCPYCGSDFESEIFYKQCRRCRRRKDY